MHDRTKAIRLGVDFIDRVCPQVYPGEIVGVIGGPKAGVSALAAMLTMPTAEEGRCVVAYHFGRDLMQAAELYRALWRPEIFSRKSFNIFLNPSTPVGQDIPDATDHLGAELVVLDRANIKTIERYRELRLLRHTVLIAVFSKSEQEARRWCDHMIDIDDQRIDTHVLWTSRRSEPVRAQLTGPLFYDPLYQSVELLRGWPASPS